MRSMHAMVKRFAAIGLMLTLACSAMAQQPAQPRRNGSQPVVSPDGSRIVFLSNRDGAPNLFMISPDGTGEVQVTSGQDRKALPHWAADGKRIFFSVAEDNLSRIFALDPSTRAQTQIGTVPGRSPMLSPDGRHVSYSAGEFREARLFVSDLDGSNAKQVTDAAAAWIGWWSPDGKRMAYALSDPAKGMHIYIMNADGSERRQLTRVAPEEGRAECPAWSPDGGRIAFQVGRSVNEARTAHIWIVDVATGEARKLAPHDNPYLDETPSWFPDGKHLAFQSDRSGRMELWVMNIDGSDPRQITR
jgi:TolB protein